MHIPLFVGLLVAFTLLMPQLSLAKESAWSYDGDNTGQDKWTMLSADYAVCESGTQQSPIQIGAATSEKLPSLEINYQPQTGELRFHEHALEISFDGKSGVNIGGRDYRLKSLRLHTPSEHVLQNIFFPLEIHLLHEDEEKKRLIIAVMAQPGQANHALQAITERLSGMPENAVEISFNPSGLLPASRGYYAYSGSLSHPPCTENVEWRIFKQPIEISADQLSAIAKVSGRNARLPQPLYMRTIRETRD
jgi:carbonic anhydrase